MDSSKVPPLVPGVVHLWRIPLNDTTDVAELRRVLSDDERLRADGFYTAELRDRYVNAHGWLRRILGRYLDAQPDALAIELTEFGKPQLGRSGGAPHVNFNLGHSGDLGVVAVTCGAAVGVDIERWHGAIGHLEIAERFFSPTERLALKALADEKGDIVAGFFAAWTRKEAYIKATGHGITRGLDHFDVTLAPGAPAQLLADRIDPDAPIRWTLAEFAAGDGYSGAVAAEAPLHEILLFDVTDFTA